MSRYTKKIPEFIYFVGKDGDWIMGPYVHPKQGMENRKFKLVEVTNDKKGEGNDINEKRLFGICK